MECASGFASIDEDEQLWTTIAAFTTTTRQARQDNEAKEREVRKRKRAQRKNPFAKERKATCFLPF